MESLSYAHYLSRLSFLTFVSLGISSPSTLSLCFFLSFSRVHFDFFPQPGVSLVSLFNGISTFVGYLMPKPFSW